MMTFNFFLLVFLCVCCLIQGQPSSDVNHHLLRCRRYYYREGKVTAVELGYCWKFMNRNYTYDGALRHCKGFHARLPSVNTVTKAKKLSKYIAAFIQSYSSGQNGAWPEGAEFWMSAINNGRWDSTKAAVSTSAAEAEQPGVREGGRQCVLFNYLKSTWRYVDCGDVTGKHPTICEEKEHVYADDVGADDMTTPSLTMAPTPAPPKGATFTCPEKFEDFYGYCFFLSTDRLSVTDAEKTCQEIGGRQVWISEAGKNGIVTSFLHANKKKIFHVFPYVWLSRIEGNGYIFKWRSSGTNARYFLNRNKLYSYRLMQGVEPKFIMRTSGKVVHCAERCMKYQAFCEADGIWKIPHPDVHVPDPHQYGQGDYEYYYYYY